MFHGCGETDSIKIFYPKLQVFGILTETNFIIYCFKNRCVLHAPVSVLSRTIYQPMGNCATESPALGSAMKERCNSPRASYSSATAGCAKSRKNNTSDAGFGTTDQVGDCSAGRVEEMTPSSA